uniref:Uncharacterized protein n=1 Tax=uncultured prokaryote TaxID=198431 RepID=A0A0H5QNH4_9ZZZZ|nr:hypothetical protein [uncultured prokaryote]
MHVNLRIEKSQGEHKLTVVARPHNAAALGEYVLIEGMVLEGLGANPTATEALREAYMAIADQLGRRRG